MGMSSDTIVASRPSAPASDAEPVRRPQTVLVATDLSPSSERAKWQAIELAAGLGARLLVVNVIDPGLLRAATPRVAPALRADQKRAEREPQLLKTVEQARGRGVAATFLLWTGDPGRSIVAAAHAEGADMLVVGTRGLDRAGRLLLGSVSEHVVYHAHCPVLVVR
ncbi:universal stress protein [soil metagenome]